LGQRGKEKERLARLASTSIKWERGGAITSEAVSRRGVGAKKERARKRDANYPAALKDTQKNFEDTVRKGRQVRYRMDLGILKKNG